VAAAEVTGTDRWHRWWSAPEGLNRSERFGGKRWPLVGALFVVPILVPATREVPASGYSAAAIAALLLGAAYGACYLSFPFVLFKKRPIHVVLAFGVTMLLIGWALLLLGASLYVLLYAMAVVAFGLPPGWVVILNGSSVVAAFALLVSGWDMHGSAGDISAIAGITTAFFFVSRLIQTVRRLRAAQAEIATLAVTAERERLARDLHDILGHSLTTITVKAGVARRVLESARDVDRAIAEIREVEGLSRSALSDVRATVSDYREVSLSAELVGAKAALRAAEIDADLPQAVDNVRTDLQQTFGYVLREAITNVIRHSGAKQVKVRFGRTWLEIEDDGDGTTAIPGNGLRGLGERLARVGGTLRAEPRADGGFVVRADVTALPSGVAEGVA